MPGCIFCPLYYILFWQFSHKLCIDENHDLISSGVSWFKALWKCCLLCKFVLILCSIWPGTKEAPLGQEVLVCRSENATPHLGGCMARLEGSMAYPHGIWIHGTPWGSRAKFEGPMVHIGGSITHLGESITHLGGFTDHLVKFMVHQLGIQDRTPWHINWGSMACLGRSKALTLPQTRSSAWLTFQGFPHGSSKHPYWWPSLCQDHTMMKCINFLPSVTCWWSCGVGGPLSLCYNRCAPPKWPQPWEAKVSSLLPGG